MVGNGVDILAFFVEDSGSAREGVDIIELFVKCVELTGDDSVGFTEEDLWSPA